MKLSMREILGFIAAILLCELAGIIGSVFTFSEIPTWYASLAKPSFSPPNWVFGPVWTALYALMGVSAYLIYKSKSKKAKGALNIFAAQLALNVLWSIAFFGFHSPLAGLVVIVLLWFSILAMIINFHEISRPVGLMQVPYLLWVSFASVLNFYIFLIN